jgi:peptidylprolyl isomerase
MLRVMRRLPLAPFLLLAACGADAKPAAPAPPGTWDLAALPDAGTVIREATTPGGTLYRVYQEGTGAEARPDEEIDIRYTGFHLDGRIFDSGVHSLELRKGGVIRGWIEGLQGIREGEKRRLLVPSRLAYRRDGKPPTIGPDEDLVFDLERIGGLVVEDLRVGTGAEAAPGATVEAHYKGMLADGTPFDSSYERGAPATFTLKAGPGGVIRGWVRGVPGMRVGGQRVLTIPSHLGYGPQGNLPKIPANADLRFIIELIAVK